MPALGSVSVLVVSWNGLEHLAEALPSLVEQRAPGVEHEVLVFDNGSRDGSAELVRARFPTVRLVESRDNVGFAAGNNRLAELARGDALALVNNDVRAEPDWLRSFVEAYRAAPDDVAALSGQLTDWVGERLDFGRGVVLFDGHALPLDQGRPLGAARLPAPGDELPFGCGGNLFVRRSSFLDAGGFDERYFAYFEDVDFGWRLWAGGERVLACPAATLRHRLSATSHRLGFSRRGALFERNALFTVTKNFEDGLRERMLPVVLLTFLSRLEAMLAAEEHGGAALRAELAGLGGPPASGEVAAAMPVSWRRRLRRRAARFLLAAAARVAPWDPRRPDRLEVASDRGLAQVRALAGFLAGLDDTERERRRLARRRRRADREILERFPLWIVPTYPGDERLFAGEAFAALLPAELRFERAALGDVVAL